MADSDGEFVADDMSDDELVDHQVTDDEGPVSSQQVFSTEAKAEAKRRTGLGKVEKIVGNELARGGSGWHPQPNSAGGGEAPAADARYDASPASYALAFVREYFEQNPISQLGIIGMRDGVAVRISDLRSQGNPSLQNALEMCRGALFHTPSHGTREVLIIYGALLSSDPGDIHETIANLVTDKIRVSIVGPLGPSRHLCRLVLQDECRG
ncbi:hypothetical protein J3459_007758 [Metarhizium acridum]|nr:hypothetical protein J3459_007758 [Metarhizium acridum]